MIWSRVWGASAKSWRMSLTNSESLRKTSCSPSTGLIISWKTSSESKTRGRNVLSHCRPALKIRRMHYKRGWTESKDRVRSQRPRLMRIKIRMKLKWEKISWCRRCGASTTKWRWTKRWTVLMSLKTLSRGSARKQLSLMFKKSFTSFKLVNRHTLICFKLSTSKKRGLKSSESALKKNGSFFRSYRWNTIHWLKVRTKGRLRLMRDLPMQLNQKF